MSDSTGDSGLSTSPSSGSAPLLLHLRSLRDRSLRGPLTLGQVFATLSVEGHSMLMIFLCLPFMQPIPLPGLSTPLGLLVCAVAVFQFLGKPPWLPQRWQNLELPPATLEKILEIAERAVLKIQSWFHPRWTFLFRGPLAWINFSVVLISGFLLAIPNPLPFSNNLPAMAIVFMALAKLEDDGLWVIASWVLFVVNVVYLSAIALGLVNLAQVLG